LLNRIRHLLCELSRQVGTDSIGGSESEKFLDCLGRYLFFERQRKRRELLQNLDTLGKAVPGSPEFEAFARSEKKAYEMMFGDARKLFDLSLEKEDLRERYGRKREIIEDKVKRWSGVASDVAQSNNQANQGGDFRKKDQDSDGGPTDKPGKLRQETRIGMPAPKPLTPPAPLKPVATSSPAPLAENSVSPTPENPALEAKHQAQTQPKTAKPKISLDAPGMQQLSDFKIETDDEVSDLASLLSNDDAARPVRGGAVKRIQLFDAVCDRCKEQTQVPFKPDPDKKVYCKECLAVVREAKKAEPDASAKAKESVTASAKTPSGFTQHHSSEGSGAGFSGPKPPTL